MTSCMRRISLAAISMSDAWPWAPPIAWCMWIVELGRAYRLPFDPELRSTVAMLAQLPTQIVATLHRRSFIVSWMASPALITPPGLLM